MCISITLWLHTYLGRPSGRGLPGRGLPEGRQEEGYPGEGYWKVKGVSKFGFLFPIISCHPRGEGEDEIGVV
ncbi:hypothetical protein QJS04_geneDACA015204 [Acorus gramineus]|uniref:Uncharacterized protein n=1 Tax=Acorus gramineus TaxID=55184 RepID=A0AAV9B9E9_ACOGR|nr:hypothetical protein QJS04_geneDACA015204 [Acorus gramineus]